jgi:hypothetical protein
MSADSDDADFVFYGTKLQAEEEAISRRHEFQKKDVASAAGSRSLPVWKQVHARISESSAARAAMPATLPSAGRLQLLTRPLFCSSPLAPCPQQYRMHQSHMACVSRRHVSSLLATRVVTAVAHCEWGRRRWIRRGGSASSPRSVRHELNFTSNLLFL